jgi:hypothetical protein
MRLPRFTVRRIMVAVAIVALIIWIHDLMERRSRLLKLTHIYICEQYLTDLELVHASVAGPSKAAELDAVRRRIEYNRSMVRKYTRAARYPWLPVEPDPPVPK